MDMRIHADPTRAFNKIRRVRESISARSILTAFGLRVRQWSVDNIRSDGALGASLGGAPWMPIKPNTVYKKGSSKALDDTGKMRRAVADAQIRVSDTTVMVSVAGPVATMMHHGTRPHRIDGNPWLFFPVPNGPIHWRGKNWVRTTKVNHPGTPPRRIMPSPAIGAILFDEVADGIVEQIRREGGK